MTRACRISGHGSFAGAGERDGRARTDGGHGNGAAGGGSGAAGGGSGAGAAALLATAAIHLDLYLTGYRTIPTIGWLFLLQVIAALGAGVLVLATGSRLVAAAGAVLSLGTLGGYLLTVQFGLFGFREVRTTAGIVAGIVEVAGFAALAVYAVTGPDAGLVSGQPRHARAVGRLGDLAKSGLAGRLEAGTGVVRAALLAGGLSVLALILLGGALAAAGGPAAPAPATGSANAAGAGLRVATIGGAQVITNAAGRTLYWFAPDTSTKSACYGSCAVYWPPVAGPLKAGPGVTGTLGTIRRTNGSLQETYDGHPLYTYIGDSGPGQAHGNNLNLNGGLWHEMTVTG
jgi:predicted lipoprotein with Yx(FWY)xxD motif